MTTQHNTSAPAQTKQHPSDTPINTDIKETAVAFAALPDDSRSILVDTVKAASTNNIAALREIKEKLTAEAQLIMDDLIAMCSSKAV